MRSDNRSEAEDEKMATKYYPTNVRIENEYSLWMKEKMFEEVPGRDE